VTFPLEIPAALRRQLPPGTGVLLGLSGGVDSAVSLALLKALECDVQCVTFKNFCYADDQVNLTEKSCCSLEAINEARRLAGRFGSPHWVGNVEERFRAQVIEPFVADFLRAETPNPCLDCNGSVRFPELVRLAERQDCAFAATGHYARMVTVSDREYRLWRALDPAKDQSYFLHRIQPELYSHLVFPLGWFSKTDVRLAAAELGLSVAQKRDSQELCFVPDGDRGFLFADRGDSAATQPGDIVSVKGEVLGQHRGLIHYTVGQRKGLGVSAAAPLHVLKLDLARRQLVVGAKSELSKYQLTAVDFAPVVPDFPAKWRASAADDPVVACVRHRNPGARVASWSLQGGVLALELTEPSIGPAPGQACVLYRGAEVLGGGRLTTDQGGASA